MVICSILTFIIKSIQNFNLRFRYRIDRFNFRIFHSECSSKSSLLPYFCLVGVIFDSKQDGHKFFSKFELFGFFRNQIWYLPIKKFSFDITRFYLIRSWSVEGYGNSYDGTIIKGEYLRFINLCQFPWDMLNILRSWFLRFIFYQHDTVLPILYWSHFLYFGAFCCQRLYFCEIVATYWKNPLNHQTK